MNLVLLSPHHDDAAFSCGIFLSLSADAAVAVQVLNIFTESSYAPFVDHGSVERVSRIRKDEDALLKTIVGDGLSFLDLGLLDAPLRLNIQPEQTVRDPLDECAHAQQVESLAELLREHLKGADCLLCPLGLGGHVDHRIARDAAMKCVDPSNLAFYEDLPYAARLNGSPLPALLESFSPIALRRVDGAAIKRRFASCYPSQVDTSTVEEMAAYTEARHGGETFYAGESAHGILCNILFSAQKGPTVR